MKFDKKQKSMEPEGIMITDGHRNEGEHIKGGGIFDIPFREKRFWIVTRKREFQVKGITWANLGKLEKSWYIYVLINSLKSQRNELNYIIVYIIYNSHLIIIQQ